MSLKKLLCLFGSLTMILTPGLLLAGSISIKAKSAILLDVNSDQILFSKNADQPLQPASLTKVLSLYLVYEALRDARVRLQDMVKISKNAVKTRGSRMRVSPGSEVPLGDLMKGMAVVSGNDASIALAEHLEGDVETFVEKMNMKARELDMTSSHFLTPNGLPARGQFTTARDVLKLSKAYLQNFPQSLDIHSLRRFSFNGYQRHNSNHLLDLYPEMDGLKTGSIGRKKGGYHIIATAKKGDARLIAVVMGCRNTVIRDKEAVKLLEAGFRMTSESAIKSINGESKVKDEAT